MRIKKQKLRLLGAAGTLSVLLAGAFMAMGGPSIVSAVRSVGDFNAVVTVEDVQLENEALRAAVTSMQANELQYQEQIDKANQIIEQLQSDLATTAGSYDTVLEEYDQSLADLQAQNAELVGTLTTMQQRDGAYAADLEGANTLLTEKNAAIELLQSRETEYLTAIDQANNSINLIQNELNNSQQAFVNLKFQYDELQSLVTLLQARELEYQARIEEFNGRAAVQGGYGGEGEHEEEEYEEDEYDDD